jgi:hypothetical protein
MLLFIGAASGLGFYVIGSRRAWAAAALCVLLAFAFWHYFLSGLPLFFRPPFGDGSLHGAALGYLRFYAAGLWLHVTKLVLLLCFSAALHSGRSPLTVSHLLATNGSNHAMQPTTGQRMIKISMTQTSTPAAPRALASRRLAVASGG